MEQHRRYFVGSTESEDGPDGSSHKSRGREYGPSNDTAHGMSHEDHRSRSMLGFYNAALVELQDAIDAISDKMYLVQQQIPIECGQLLIPIDREIINVVGSKLCSFALQVL